MGLGRDTALHPMVRKVVGTVRRQRLLRPSDRVLVAVSGGPDSVCLLMVLHEIAERGAVPGLDLHAAHVNYGLRGEESEQDEAYVRDLGARLGLPVHVEHIRLVPGRGRSLQSRAREARYAFFARVLRDCKLTAVATGHTADDQAETVLLWLLRGSGTVGLSGIPVQRDGGIIRPLLGVTREEVLDYLACRGIAYRTDSSNATPSYRRNRIRHEIVPVLRAFNPRIVEALARAAVILAAEAAILGGLEREQWADIVMDASPGRVVLRAERLARQPLGLQRRLVRRALAGVRGTAAGLTYQHVSDVLERVVAGRPGARLHLPGGFIVERCGALVAVSPVCAERADSTGEDWVAGIPLPIPGTVRIGATGWRLTAVEGGARTQDRAVGRSKLVIDADRLGGPLTVRGWRAGDWFCPSGMAGHRKKLQDFFVDQKVQRRNRGSIPLVVAPAGIVWVVGYRGDERFLAGKTTVHPVTLSWEEP